MTMSTLVDEIQSELSEKKGKKVNARSLKVGDTISLPVFPDGKRKMINFKVTKVGPHAAGGTSVKASSVKPGLADTARVFSAKDSVTLIEAAELPLVDEIKELTEPVTESKVGAVLVLGKIRDMEKKIVELQRISLPSKIEGRRVAGMDELKGIAKNLSDMRKALKKIHYKVVGTMEGEN
jgi:hypothetical protein